MKKLLTLLFIASTLIVQAQHKQTRQLDAHKGISVSTNVHVKYIKSNKNEIILDCEKDEHLDLLLTDVKNGILEIRYKPNSKIKTKKSNKVTIYSSYNLKSAKASASADLTINDPIQADDFTIVASSSNDIVTNTIQANKITTQVSSSADIHSTVHTTTVNINASISADTIISGSAKHVIANMSSSADIDLQSLKIENLTINGSSSADLIFDTATNLDSNLFSSASVYYKIKPSNITNNKRSSGATLGKK